MDDLGFLEDRTETKTGNATLTVTYTDGCADCIGDLDIAVIEVACPLLALAFEDTRSGPKHYIEDVSRGAIASLLRFIHVFPRDYIPEELKSTNISMLLHVEVYHLATIYDMPELQMQASSNITQDCELACSTTRQPLDLCKAIRFIYGKLSKEQKLIETITNYCVTCFLSNKLDENTEFKDIAYELRQFQQDICLINYKRGFVDDAALGIIQLPIKPYRDPYKEMAERRVLGDFLYDLWEVKKTTDGEKVDVVREHVITAAGERRTTFAQARANPFPLPYRPRTISTSDRLCIVEALTEDGLNQMASQRLATSSTVHSDQTPANTSDNPAETTHKPMDLYTSFEPNLLPEKAAVRESLLSAQFNEPQQLKEPLFFPSGPLIDYSSSMDSKKTQTQRSNWADPSWLGTTLLPTTGRTSNRTKALDDAEHERYVKRASDVFAQAQIMLQSDRPAWPLGPVTAVESDSYTDKSSDAFTKKAFPDVPTFRPGSPSTSHQSPWARVSMASRVPGVAAGPSNYDYKQQSQRTAVMRPGARPRPDNSETEEALQSISKLAKRSRRTISEAQEQFRSEKGKSRDMETPVLRAPGDLQLETEEPWPIRRHTAKRPVYIPRSVRLSTAEEIHLAERRWVDKRKEVAENVDKEAERRAYIMGFMPRPTQGARHGRLFKALYQDDEVRVIDQQRTTARYVSDHKTPADVDAVPTAKVNTPTPTQVIPRISSINDCTLEQFLYAIPQAQPSNAPPASTGSDAETEYDMVTTPSSPPARPAMSSLKSKKKTDKVPHLGADYDPVVPPTWMMGAKKVVLPECPNGAAESVSSLAASTKTLRLSEPATEAADHDDFLQVDAAASDSDWDLV